MGSRARTSSKPVVFAVGSIDLSPLPGPLSDANAPPPGAALPLSGNGLHFGGRSASAPSLVSTALGGTGLSVPPPLSIGGILTRGRSFGDGGQGSPSIRMLGPSVSNSASGGAEGLEKAGTSQHHDGLSLGQGQPHSSTEFPCSCPASVVTRVSAAVGTSSLRADGPASKAPMGLTESFADVVSKTAAADKGRRGSTDNGASIAPVLVCGSLFVMLSSDATRDLMNSNEILNPMD